ncbi:hypothetical protein ACFYN3_31220 [Streptomyces lavendulae]|uniref:hypothetical protein n=1 Tax=Streptomyces lavendulae TaxID=1914 RepID=UPI00369EA8BE
MLIFPRSGSTGLLTVEGSTYPDYLPVSKTYNVETGTVTINIGLPPEKTQKIYCKKITIRIPTGAGSDHLTTNIQAPGIATSGPEPGNNVPGRSWTITKNTANPGYVEITCTPLGFGNSGFAEFTPGGRKVGFAMSQIAISVIPGDVTITVIEETHTQPTGTYTPRTSFYDVRKYDGILYFHSLRAEPSVVERGQKATLVWDGSPEAEYTMFTNGVPHPESNVPSGGLWKSAALDDDTEFTLEARTLGPGNVPVYRRLTTSVIVKNANKSLNTLRVSNIAAVTNGGTITADDHFTMATNRDLRTNSLKSTTTSGTITAGNHFTVASGNYLRTNILGSTSTNSAISCVDNFTLDAAKDLRTNSLRSTTTNGTIGVVNKTNFSEAVVCYKDTTVHYPAKFVAGNGIRIDGNITSNYPGVQVDTDVNLSRTANFNGPINLNGPVGSGAQSGSLAMNTTKSFVAPTSGILLGHAYSGSRYSGVKVYIWGVSGPRPHTVESSATADQTPNSNYLIQHSGVSALVRKGDNVSIRAEVLPNSANPPSYLNAWWVWYPFGSSGNVLLADSYDTPPDPDVVNPPSEGDEER